MNDDPETAGAKLVAFVETLAETALRQTALDKMTVDEQVAIRKTVDRLTWAIEELTKVVAEHPKSSVQAHALNELWGALSAAFVIGNRATMNPVAERIEREGELASAAHARRQKDEESKALDDKIIECANQLWRRKPTLRRSAGKTAETILESKALPGLDMKSNSLEKRVRKLMKTGQLTSPPTI